MGNANVKGPPTPAQWHALAIFKMVLSIPSLLGSAFIIQHIVRSEARRQRVFSRLMLGMSLMDLIFAVYSSVGPLPCPQDPNTFLAHGTWASCEAFGFLGQASQMSSMLYNAGLALYYLLTIRYQWPESQSKRWIEVPIHLVCFVVGWGTALAALVLDLYNPSAAGCGIYAYPIGCDFLPGMECLRGKNAASYQLGLFLYAAWAMSAFMAVCMLFIYAQVAKTEQTTVRFRRASSSYLSGNPLQEQDQRRMRITSLRRGFATQALLYCLAFVLTWVFRVSGAMIVEYRNPPVFYYPIALLSVSMASLMGFFNACIYIRPRYLRYRRQEERRIRQRVILGELATNTNSNNNSDKNNNNVHRPQGSSNDWAREEFTLSTMEAVKKALDVNCLDDVDELLEMEELQQADNHHHPEEDEGDNHNDATKEPVEATG